MPSMPLILSLFTGPFEYLNFLVADMKANALSEENKNFDDTLFADSFSTKCYLHRVNWQGYTYVEN